MCIGGQCRILLLKQSSLDALYHCMCCHPTGALLSSQHLPSSPRPLPPSPTLLPSLPPSPPFSSPLPPTKVFDESALSTRCKDEMYKCYPDAKRAHLKSGGNFPYLSRSSEVNLMLQVHVVTSIFVHKPTMHYKPTPCSELVYGRLPMGL